MTLVPAVKSTARVAHEKWLLALTAIPTASGREDRVIEWVLKWVAGRGAKLAVVVDVAGNLLIHQGPSHQATGRAARNRPLLITAHLDHPAFVLREVIDAKRARFEFRGGVHDPYFTKAAVEIIDGSDRTRPGVIESLDSKAKPYKQVVVRISGAAAPLDGAAKGRKKSAHAISGTTGLDVGDIARWKLPSPRIVKAQTGQGLRTRVIRTHACDDLAALAAALATLDSVAGRAGFEHVGVLLTVAEEVGFVGAIAAARNGSIPREARLICLENSRSFADSPIGHGAILRVGDRMSVFSPELTNQLGQLYLEHQRTTPAFTFQRKLMAGGACEATAFASYGYESTCLCLPLGNYHNMQDIDGALAGKAAKVGPEFVALDDYHGLIEMLLVAAAGLDDLRVPSFRDRMEKIFADNRAVVVGLR